MLIVWDLYYLVIQTEQRFQEKRKMVGQPRSWKHTYPKKILAKQIQTCVHDIMYWEQTSLVFFPHCNHDCVTYNLFNLKCLCIVFSFNYNASSVKACLFYSLLSSHTYSGTLYTKFLVSVGWMNPRNECKLTLRKMYKYTSSN